MDDTDRQKLLSAAFHDVETIVAGHAMRPLSLASYDVLLRTGNPLVKGEMPKVSLLRPAQVKAVDAVPFPKAGRELVPLAPGDQDPPDPIESFSKIGRLPALFSNVRSRLGRVKLIFLGA